MQILIIGFDGSNQTRMFRTLQSLAFTDLRLDRPLSLWSIQSPRPNQKSEVFQLTDLVLGS